MALGQCDPDYVNAFYGPAEWNAQAEKEKKSLDAIGENSYAAASGDELLKFSADGLNRSESC